MNTRQAQVLYQKEVEYAALSSKEQSKRGETMDKQGVRKCKLH
ncbi:MAG: hypothetical protein ACOYEH_10920 [Caldicoprobacterales bacterium]